MHGGGPWRVSYKLRFGALQVLTSLVTLVIVVIGWRWPRVALLSTVLVLWLAGYGALHLVASHAFRRLLRGVMADVVERRAQPRTKPTAGAQATSQHPE